MKLSIRWRWVLVYATASCMFAAGCNSGTFGNMYSQAQEQELGNNAAADVNSHEKIDHDPLLNGDIQAIATPIFVQASKMRPGIPYQIRIIDSPDVNAFSLPGGYVYIYKGLLDKLGNDPDAIACVIGHECAHIVRRHVVKQLTDAGMKGQIVNMVGITTHNANAYGAAQDVYELDELHYSRNDEYEADKYGLYFAYNAGYDVTGMLRMFKMLEVEEKKTGEPPAYVMDHPLSRNRELRAAIEIEQLHANGGQYPDMIATSTQQAPKIDNKQ
jgi:predicted Zn-dependent protease